jgi:hypothetical protein
MVSYSRARRKRESTARRRRVPTDFPRLGFSFTVAHEESLHDTRAALDASRRLRQNGFRLDATRQLNLKSIARTVPAFQTHEQAPGT